MLTKQLYKLSKYVYYEIFLQSQLETQALNQAKFMESLEKNQKAMKVNDIVMKISLSIFITMVIILPIQGFLNITAAIAQGIATDWVIFVGGMTFALFFIVQVGYLMLFGMLISSSFMSGEMVKWLYTLPIDRKDLRKVIFFTFFRSIDVQSIILLLVLPVATAIIQKSVLLTLIALGISILCVVVSFSGLVLLGEKIYRVLQNNDVNSPKANFIRISTMLGYGLGSLVIVFLFEFGITAIEGFFLQNPISSTTLQIVNVALAWIPIPFAPAYLMTALTVKSGISPYLWISAILGLLIMVQWARKMLKSALKKLQSVVHMEPQSFEAGAVVKASDVHMAIITPVQAFVKKDLSMASRDMQLMMMLVMPLILPCFALLAVAVQGVTAEMGEEDLYVLSSLASLYNFIGAMMLVAGLLNVESSGVTIMSSLPIVIRDQAKAKMRIMLVISLIAGILPIILNSISHFSIDTFAVQLSFLAYGPIFALFGLELKVMLFGKMKYHYSLEEININAKIIKWIILIASQIVLYVILLILSFSLLLAYGVLPFLIIMGLIEIGIMGILVFLFNRMFPLPLNV